MFTLKKYEIGPFILNRKKEGLIIIEQSLKIEMKWLV